MTSDNIYLRAALVYTQQLHWYIFPLRPRTKIPITPHGFRDASCDPEQIKHWWRKFPSAGMGVDTERSNLAVIDLDGEQGLQNWKALEEVIGNVPCGLQRSGGGGLHRFYRQPAEGSKLRTTTSVLAKGVDTKGLGGCITVAPSLHPSGNPYRWLPESVKLEQLPFLPTYLLPPDPTPFVPAGTGTASAVAERALLQCYEKIVKAPQGTANTTLYKAGFRLYKLVYEGLLPETRALDTLTAAAVGRGIPQSEINSTLKSARKGAAKR